MGILAGAAECHTGEAMSFGPPEPDELPGYVKRTLALAPEDDGTLCATLVCKEGGLERTGERGRVLYLHGYCDYFFQTHLADAFTQAGYGFFALDLRRYGRSLRDHNRPNYALYIDDYFEEISASIALVAGDQPLSIVAHSTGGLLASLYAKRGLSRESVSALILNSPFFRFPTSGLLELKLRLGRQVGKLLPKRPLPRALNRVYGMTIHASKQGSFAYDLGKKPLKGFPFYGGWIDMILSAQAEVERGLDLSLPVLCLHSDHSHTPGDAPTPEDFRADTVLRVEDIARLAPRLGRRVSVEAIVGGLHDLVLSAPEVRQLAIERMLSFLNEEAPASR